MERSRGRAGARLLSAAALVLAAFGLSQGGQGRAVVASTGKKLCTRAGVRYVGTTSQKQRVCFTLSRDSKRLREYAFVSRVKCDGTASLATTQVGYGASVEVEDQVLITSREQNSALAKDGSFFEFPPGEAASRFTGKLKTGGKASGKLRQRIKFDDGTVCESGTARWSAHKVG
jgi:hypothetical protein